MPLALGKRILLVEVLEVWDCKCPEMLMERVTFGNVREMAACGGAWLGIEVFLRLESGGAVVGSEEQQESGAGGEGP